MKFTWFIGIDVSKATIDVAFCYSDSAEKFTHAQFANTIAGFKQLLAWLKKQKADITASLFCMEHTGHYTLALCCRFGDPIFARKRVVLYLGGTSSFEKISRYYKRQE